MSYITNDVDALADFVTFQLPQVLAGLATVILVFPVMFFFNSGLTLVSLIVIPPLVILTLAFQGKIQESFVETRKKIAVVTAKLQEGISGVRVTQSFVEEDRASENFDSANVENLRANLRANRLTSLFNALVQLIEACGIAFVIWYGSREIISGVLSVGVLVAFLFYLNSFFNPIIQLTTFYNSYQSAVTGFDRVLQVLDTPIEVSEPKISKRILSAESQGKIEFQDVSFGYDQSLPVLKNVSLKIDSNEVIAIVGPTGAGKSSLVSLILRFYDPQNGSVLVDGVDVREMKFKEFRGKISIVPQDPFLFQATILDNIRYGRQDAADDEVIEVGKKVGLDEVVKKFPEGYHTMINEAATNLSMGQKQMICFSRALLRNPKILILDEATSGVDPVAEVQLQKALTLLLENRTAIIIAHRLSTVRLADRIIVLQGGRIVEEGRFDQLLERREGIFANMYAMQFQGAANKL
jgi:ABC-type multidrug transport system fused ATPase/permease subunit